MAYLEQSTRYVPYTDRPGGRWKYSRAGRVDGTPLRPRYVDGAGLGVRDLRAMDSSRMEEHFRAQVSRKTPDDSDGVYRSAIRAKALDTLRGLLPAATQSNVGLFGTGQAYEALLLRMRAHPLAEVRDVRRPDARRAPEGDPGVPHARRPARSRRRWIAVPRRDERGHDRVIADSSLAGVEPRTAATR